MFFLIMSEKSYPLLEKSGFKDLFITCTKLVKSDSLNFFTSALFDSNSLNSARIEKKFLDFKNNTQESTGVTSIGSMAIGSVCPRQ